MARPTRCRSIPIGALLCLAFIGICNAQYWSYYVDSAGWGGSCANGTTQSPIDIDIDVSFPTAEPRQSKNPVQLNYSTSVELKSERTSGGVDQVAIPPGSYATLNGTQFQALSLHWHSPAEHALNGIRAANELHIVHANSSGTLAVLSVSYTRGNQSDPLLQAFLDNIPPHVPQGQNSTGPSFGPIDLNATVGALLPSGGDGFFWNYVGSLTTPPCTEGVNWYVSTKLAQMSDSQIVAFQTYSNGGNSTLATNSRPLQNITPSISVQALTG